jgi:nicotinamidase-related amidase
MKMKMTKIASIVVVACMFSVLWAGSEAPKKQESKLMKPALVVMDIQNQFLPMMSEQDRPLRMINYAITLFRQQGYPVIRVYHTDPTYGPKPDTEAFQFPSSVIIKDDDPKIVKNYPSAFKKTELDKVLRQKGCNTVFLCGLSAVGCVLATYFGALDLDYDVFLIEGTLMSHNSQYTQWVETIFHTVDFHALQVMLQNARK